MSVAKRWLERRIRPCLDRAAWHDVGMAEQEEHRPLRTVHRPQVIHLSMTQVFDREAGARQTLGNHALATRIVRRYRNAVDQFTGQVENGGHRRGEPRSRGVLDNILRRATIIGWPL